MTGIFNAARRDGARSYLPRRGERESKLGQKVFSDLSDQSDIGNPILARRDPARRHPSSR